MNNQNYCNGSKKNNAVLIYQCSNNFWYKVIYYWMLPILTMIFFIILSLPSVDAFFAVEIPNFYYRLYVKALILFVIVYILDRLIENWSINNITCNSPADIAIREYFRERE